MKGHVVFSCAFFGHSDNIEYTKEQKEILDEVHRRKIALSDSIFVINPNGYIGESTRREIDFAIKYGKEIIWLSMKGEKIDVR